MAITVDCIRYNKKFTWILAIAIGLFFYYGLLLARLAVRHIIKIIPSEFYYDNLHGEIVLNLIIINLAEIILVGMVVSIVMSLVLIVVCGNKGVINTIIVVSVYLFLSFVSLRAQLVTFEFDWTWWIKITRPFIVSVIFFTVVKLMSNKINIR